MYTEIVAGFDISGEILMTLVGGHGALEAHLLSSTYGTNIDLGGLPGTVISSLISTESMYDSFVVTCNVIRRDHTSHMSTSTSTSILRWDLYAKSFEI